jgi:hypothetical protein
MEVLQERGLVAAGGGELAGGAHRFHSPFPVHASEQALLAGCCTCYATAAMLLRGERPQGQRLLRWRRSSIGSATQARAGPQQ